MKKKIFISGPIQGMEANQFYRDMIREICLRHNRETLDPWKREKIIYRGNEREWWSKVPAADFIKRDLEDIEKCDILVAYLPKLSAGTCMELFYAKLKGKKTICICEIENPSPWIIVHSDVVLKRIEDLDECLTENVE
ncbi:nucleoside 2-deoxyribosyltransferase [Candidatus Bathyarchaeota archaeon]|nr:nucleoside 2-deoxyribosyltransferase [Candidatus Bathyarchaeota archaeon]